LIEPLQLFYSLVADVGNKVLLDLTRGDDIHVQSGGWPAKSELEKLIANPTTVIYEPPNKYRCFLVDTAGSKWTAILELIQSNDGESFLELIRGGPEHVH